MDSTELPGFHRFALDDGEARIFPDKTIYVSSQSKSCTYAPPAGLYTVKDRDIGFDCAGFLECGTCRDVCPHTGVAIIWKYPRDDFGIGLRSGWGF
jgi:ferredoxin like protein